MFDQSCPKKCDQLFSGFFLAYVSCAICSIRKYCMCVKICPKNVTNFSLCPVSHTSHEQYVSYVRKACLHLLQKKRTNFCLCVMAAIPCAMCTYVTTARGTSSGQPSGQPSRQPLRQPYPPSLSRVFPHPSGICPKDVSN